ncbi:unnamed protein product [Spirodela intermedia]|uniref:Uncharacterized protein n=1 Tax=Spirodela intermedia TaxID=51605 RepID=A0A7I8JMF3_SPIIN|nr:unnamed protein product [Spirodela intermedia]CAA6671337.1 unnamed protein product [Spirodela intermedia]
MLGTRMQFGRGEDRFYPAKARSYDHHRSRNLQRSRSCGSANGVNGGFTSSTSTASSGKFAVEVDREPENRTAGHEGSKPADAPAATVGSAPSGNLDRFLESTTPSLTGQYLPKTTMRGWRTCNMEQQPYFVLGDLWESFKEWSAYGTGVPLLLNDTDLVMQYYVPYLSAIQLYVEPRREPSNLRGPGEESDSDCSRDSSSDGSSDCELERGLKHSWGSNHQHLASAPALRMDRLSLREKHEDSQESSSSDDLDAENSQGLLLFEFLERDLPYSREPLADKISDLAVRFPELKTLRSCDLLPSSWISVAWYPIYRIPTGPTLRDLDACFLTFHSLSTPIIEPDAGPSISFPNGEEGVPKVSLPSFGLASYKLVGSVWATNGGAERQLARSLLEAADSWLRHHRVAHPDYQFFTSHGPYFR